MDKWLENREPPIINLAFTCRYIDGEAAVSEESEDVRWVTPEEAACMVTHPLYAKRLSDILKADGSIAFSSYEYDNRTTVFRTDEKMKKRNEKGVSTVLSG